MDETLTLSLRADTVLLLDQVMIAGMALEEEQQQQQQQEDAMVEVPVPLIDHMSRQTRHGLETRIRTHQAEALMPAAGMEAAHTRAAVEDYHQGQEGHGREVLVYPVGRDRSDDWFVLSMRFSGCWALVSAARLLE